MLTNKNGTLMHFCGLPGQWLKKKKKIKNLRHIALPAFVRHTFDILVHIFDDAG